MIWRIRFEVAGGHVHCTVFLAPGPEQTFANCGTLCVCRGPEFAALHRAWAAGNVQWWPTGMFKLDHAAVTAALREASSK